MRVVSYDNSSITGLLVVTDFSQIAAANINNVGSQAKIDLPQDALNMSLIMHQLANRLNNMYASVIHKTSEVPSRAA